MLNFGSGKGPGGGFLNGAKSQQSDLCQHSALYPVIKNQKEYFRSVKQPPGYSSDAMLYSPDVPFVFDENFQPYPAYFTCSVITAASVDLKKLKKEPDSQEKSKTVMLNRIRILIQCAIVNNVNHLVLGEFGCGSSGNKSVDIAQCFEQVLNVEKFRNYFDEVIFSIPVLGKSDPNLWSKTLHVQKRN